MAEKKKNYSWIIVALVVLFFIGKFSDNKKQPFAGHPEKKVEHHISRKVLALTKCQDAIKKASRDYDAAKVPYSEDFGGSNEFYFAWNNRNPIKLINGFGRLVPTTGSCIVDADLHIKSLTVGGKDIAY